MSNYQFQEVDNNEIWDDFIFLSTEGTIFSSSKFLMLDQIKHLRKWVIKGNEKIAALHVPLLEENCSLENLFIYSGLIHRPRRNQMNNYQFLREKFDVQTFVVGYLSQLKTKFSINLNPNINDIRPVIWKNFNEDKKILNYDIRYTGFLKFPKNMDELEFTNFWLAKMSSSRRQEIKKSVQNRESVEISKNIEFLLFFLEKKLKQDNVNLEEKFYNVLKSQIEILLKLNKASLWNVKDENGNELFAVLWVKDNKRAYYYLGSKNSHSSYNSSSAGTIILFESIKRLYFDEKIVEFDFEGLNSPKRGWFKQSFGAEVINYFNIRNT